MVLFRKILVVVALLGLGAIIPYVAYHDDSTDLLQPTETPVVDNPVVQKFIDDYTDACVNYDYQSFLELIHPKVRKQYEDEWIKCGDSDVNVLYLIFGSESTRMTNSYSYYLRKPTDTLTYRIRSYGDYYTCFEGDHFSPANPKFYKYDAEEKYGIDAKYFKVLIARMLYQDESGLVMSLGMYFDVVCKGEHIFRSFNPELISMLEYAIDNSDPLPEVPEISEDVRSRVNQAALQLIRGALDKDQDVLKKMMYSRDAVLIEKKYLSFCQKETEAIYRWFRHVGSADNLKDIKCDYQEYILPESDYFPELRDQYTEKQMPELHMVYVLIKRLICRDGVKPADVALYFVMDDKWVSFIVTESFIDQTIHPEKRRANRLERLAKATQVVRNTSEEIGEIAAKEWLKKNPGFTGTKAEFDEFDRTLPNIFVKHSHKTAKEQHFSLSYKLFEEGFLNALKKQFPDKSGK